MAERLWQLEHVCSLGHPRPRLEDVSVGIRTGVTALVGGSGAGKTSLLNLLAGFERPDSGTIIESLCTPAGRLGLYWVPQDAGLWPHLTARAHLAAVAPGGPDDERVDALLRSFALCDRKDARPEQMSLGERARLSVARALASRAAVLVMDEPLAHVDPARTGAFWDEIKRWCEDAGTSIVYATHSPRSVLRQATDVICMQDGRAIWSGAVAELYHRPASRELMSYLGDGNWLEPDEAKLWLGVDRNRAECWRPETLALAAQDSGPLVVTASRHLGATTETLLARTDGEARRAFYHATPPTPPVPGQRPPQVGRNDPRAPCERRLRRMR